MSKTIRKKETKSLHEVHRMARLTSGDILMWRNIKSLLNLVQNNLDEIVPSLEETRFRVKIDALVSRIDAIVSVSENLKR